jgi:hypothetical protein
VLAPATTITSASRDPVITIDAAGGCGVTDTGALHAPHPAPVSARTRKEYCTPLRNPVTEHDTTGDGTTHEPDGEPCT